MSVVSSDSVAQDQLISYVRRIESLEDEAKAIGDDKSEVYKEARGNGFDTKIIRKVIQKRRLGSAEREQQDALFQLYWDAIHGVARAHVENIDEFPPHDADGVVIEDEIPAAVLTAQLIGANSETPAVAPAVSESADMQDGSGPVEVHTLEQAGSTPAPATNSEPASLTPSQEIAEPGDRSAVNPAAAPVTEISTKKRWTFNDPAHRDCLDPGMCGGFSNLKLCQRCREASAMGQVA